MKQAIVRLALLIVVIVGATSASRSTAAPAAITAALPSSVAVQVFPSAAVVGQGDVVVSFGLPLPPGALIDPLSVSVHTDAGQELPAFVKSLGPWRFTPPASLLCAPVSGDPGLRSVLVQFSHSFSSTDPLTFVLRLDQQRSLDVPNEVPVRDTWHLVDSGTYTAADGIYEPQVYAVLPPEWLTCSNLTTLASVAGAHAELAAMDQGQVDFFTTVINDFNPTPDPAALIPYKTDYEPWLYDRGQTFYNGYIRTGRLDFLREAQRATQDYMAHLYVDGDCPGLADQSWCRGFFSRKNDDPNAGWKDSKYSYNEALATLYWLTGDPEPLAHLADVSSATHTEVALTRRFQTAAETGAFTERHWANALLAPIIEYEVTGNQAAADYAREGLQALYEMQTDPVENNPATGCFNHYVEGQAPLGFSPWMSSLMAHALLRAYHTLGDARIPTMLVALAQCERERAIYWPADAGAPAQWMPRYIASGYGPPTSLDGDPWSDVEHALDVAYVTALGAYFSPDLAQQQQLLDVTYKLLDTHRYVLDYWTRPSDWPGNGLPLYRVNPPRKYAWWYKNAGAIGRVLQAPSFTPTNFVHLPFVMR